MTRKGTRRGRCNFGYWRPDTSDHKQACENLVDALLPFIPEKQLGTAKRLGRSWDVRLVLRLMLFDAALLTGMRQYLLVAARKP